MSAAGPQKRDIIEPCSFVASLNAVQVWFPRVSPLPVFSTSSCSEACKCPAGFDVLQELRKWTALTRGFLDFLTCCICGKACFKNGIGAASCMKIQPFTPAEASSFHEVIPGLSAIDPHGKYPPYMAQNVKAHSNIVTSDHLWRVVSSMPRSRPPPETCRTHRSSTPFVSKDGVECTHAANAETPTRYPAPWPPFQGMLPSFNVACDTYEFRSPRRTVIRNLVALSLFCSTALWTLEGAQNAEIGKWGRILFSPILSIGARGGPGTQIGICRQFLFDRFGITPPEPLEWLFSLECLQFE
jgi:hypothetical protein